MKRFPVVQANGSTSSYTSGAAAATGLTPTFPNAAMPQWVLVTIERGKEAFFKFYSDFFGGTPADASLMHISDNVSPILLNIGPSNAFIRYKEKTAGAILYVTPVSNH